MAVDTFTETLRVAVFVAVAWGLAYGIVVGVKMQRLDRSRPYDWRIDGECDNRSHPRVLP